MSAVGSQHAAASSRDPVSAVDSQLGIPLVNKKLPIRSPWSMHHGAVLQITGFFVIASGQGVDATNKRHLCGMQPHLYQKPSILRFGSKKIWRWGKTNPQSTRPPLAASLERPRWDWNTRHHCCQSGWEPPRCKRQGVETLVSSPLHNWDGVS